MFRWMLPLAMFLPLVLIAYAQEATDPYANKVAKASDEWKKTVQRMKLPADVKADLWAAEPHVANIVAFHFDEKGRCYVAETFRLSKGSRTIAATATGSTTGSASAARSRTRCASSASGARCARTRRSGACA